MEINEKRVERIARGVFNAMRYNASEIELKKAVKRAMKYIDNTKGVRRAA